jgi:hypothetical protein
MGLGKRLKKAISGKKIKGVWNDVTGGSLKGVGLDFGASAMVGRQDANQAIITARQLTEAERKAKEAEEARIFAENETNKAIKAEKDRKQTLFGGEIEQQLREKKELLGEAEDPEEIARKEFLRRKLLGM